MRTGNQELLNCAIAFLDHCQYKIAYIDDDGSYTYGYLSSAAKKFATYLRNNSIGPKDRVLLSLPDSIFYPIAFLGCLWIGAIPCCTGKGKCGGIEVDNIKDAVDKIKPKLIIDQYRKIDYEHLSEDDTPHLSHPSDIAYAINSGGTTSANCKDQKSSLYSPGEGPKYIFHSQYTLYNHGDWSDIIAPTDKKVFCAEKIGGSYGVSTSLSFIMKNGLTGILTSKPASTEVLNEIIEKHRPDIFVGTPQHFFYLRDKEYPFIRIAMSGGLPVRDRLKGVKFLDIHGQAEVASVYLINGKPRFPNYPGEVRLDETGELYIRTPFKAVKFADGDTRDEYLKHEWIRTKDKFIIENGLYKFVGRVD
jgi:benzoate-CoA ligase